MSDSQKTPIDLDALLEKVNDEDSFVEFVSALAEDFRMKREIEAANPSQDYRYRGALGWENGSVDTVLDAAARWAEDARGRWSKAGEGATWYRCAQILLAGKFYE